MAEAGVRSVNAYSWQNFLDCLMLSSVTGNCLFLPLWSVQSLSTVAEVLAARAGVLRECQWTSHLSAASLAALTAGAHRSLLRRQVMSCRLQCRMSMSWLEHITGQDASTYCLLFL